jgi:hypothetical protein
VSKLDHAVKAIRLRFADGLQAASSRKMPIGSPPRYSTPLIAQMSPPSGLKRSNITHLPSGDQTG